MIMDITRPTENATDDELIAAGEEYVSHLADLANGVGFSRSGSASTKAVKTMVQEFRRNMKKHGFAHNETFSLDELLEALKVTLAKQNLAVDSENPIQLGQVAAKVVEHSTTIIDNLGIKKQKAVELAHAVRASRNVKLDLDKIHTATGIPKKQYPGEELQKIIPKLQAAVGSQEGLEKVVADLGQAVNSLADTAGVHTEKGKLEEIQSELQRMTESVNKTLWDSLQERTPTTMTVLESARQVNIALIDIIGRLPGDHNTWAGMRTDMLSHMETAIYLSAEAGVRINSPMDGPKVLAAIQAAVVPLEGVDAATVKRLQSQINSLSERLSTEKAAKKQLEGQVEDLEVRLAHAQATGETTQKPHPSETPPYWQQVAKNSGAPANVYRAVDDKGSAERGLFGLVTKLHATIDSLKQNPMVGGEDNSAWNCELKCKLTQFDGECQLVLAWEAQVQQEALTIWNESKAGFQEYARVVFLGALCKHASEWARYTDLETPTATTETFGEALQALIDLLKTHFGVDMAEEKRRAEEIFDCQPIHADCWGNFWLQFVGQAGRAGYKDELQAKTSTLIKNRILRKLPAKDMNRLKMVALNRADAAGMPSDPWQLSQSDLQNLLARTWKKEQENPVGQVCTRLVCKSGLPPDKCPCKKQVNFADMPQEPDPRCKNHPALSSQQKGVVFSNLKGLPKKNDDSGTSPSFRACQKMSVCARCNGKFNTAKFDEWWNNGQKM
jgi:hypothetical protein